MGNPQVLGRPSRAVFSARTIYLVVAAVITVSLAGIGTSRLIARPRLDGQLTRIGAAVRTQLVEKGADPGRADLAAASFTASLRGALDQPLSDAQLKGILASLKHRLGGFCLYSDFTDLEIEYHTLRWTDQIKLYVKRKPMTPAEEKLLNRQVDDLVRTLESLLTQSLAGRPEMSKVPKFVSYLRMWLDRDLNDAVLPALKRPFTKAELDALRTYLRDEISEALEKWQTQLAEPPAHRLLGPYCIDVAITPVLNMFPRHYYKLQYTYTPPSLSPEKMKRMRDQRRALILGKARRFDELPPDEKEREYEQMREEAGK